MLARTGLREALHGVAPRPSARLLPLHRHTLTHVMILGGEPDERRAIALTVHAESVLRSGPFVAVDCARGEDRLCRALQAWMTGADDSSDPSILAAERGTLFLDSLETLTDRAQRQLLAFVTGAHGYGWAGRVVCGAREDLALRARDGRFLMPLFDCLDKARVELAGYLEGGAA